MFSQHEAAWAKVVKRRREARVTGRGEHAVLAEWSSLWGVQKAGVRAAEPRRGVRVNGQ